MSNTKKQNAKIQATNKLFLNEYKQEVLSIIEEKIDKINSAYLTQKEHSLRLYKQLLKGCECNKATIDFIKQQIR